MRILKNTKKLHLYKSLDSLKILTFWKVLKERNACLLDIDYSIGKKYNQEQELEIEQTWIRLYDEFFVLRNDNRSKHEIVKGFDELKIQAQILNVKMNYDHLIKIKEFVGLLPEKDVKQHTNQTYDRIKSLYEIGKKIKIDYAMSVDYNLRQLKRVLNSLENSYNLGIDKTKKVVKQEINNVYDVVSEVENALGRSLPIEDIVCSRWIAYEKQAVKKRKKPDDG